MAAQEATPGSQPEESGTLDLPSAYDIRDYVLQRPSQDANSGAFSSVESFSFPCSSDVDPEDAPGTCAPKLLPSNKNGSRQQ
ncbi:shieldin complex subunit 1 isoform X2 [Talpa occidentalis]|uniref:shieldin complex subunit 1 isoform X2 n=1 Tax=Talpa occidentalis TaxID=50954 RepID=UPI00188FBCDA|nr:shieldin complex subunit 1 isoform X2 [Talpa occidentalis]